jgi:DNA-binding NarL/FixJ family response regulator
VSVSDDSWPAPGADGQRPVRVLLVDDQQLVRAGLRMILCPEEGFEVVGECADGADVPAAVAAQRPDVVVMDVRMPRVDGAEATRRLRADPGAPPVLVLTTFKDDEVLSAALRSGASGFLLKDAPGEEILRATREVAGGGAYLDPAVTARVLAAYRAAPPAPAAPPDTPSPRGAAEELTARETEVLRAIGQGLTNEEIATALSIGEGTVKTHVGRIFDKLGLRDRAAAIIYAYDHGLARPSG